MAATVTSDKTADDALFTGPAAPRLKKAVLDQEPRKIWRINGNPSPKRTDDCRDPADGGFRRCGASPQKGQPHEHARKILGSAEGSGFLQIASDANTNLRHQVLLIP